MKQLCIRNGDKITVTLEKDESTYGTGMPPELEELLLQDGEGKQRFLLVAPGMQRYILQYVENVKSSQLRIYRAILLIENLKQLPRGKETFPAMLGLRDRRRNEKIKSHQTPHAAVHALRRGLSLA